MFSIRQRLTALVLALSHAVIGATGYGLHGLAPCHDQECQEAAVTVCCCGHLHEGASQSPKAARSQETATLPPGAMLAKSRVHDRGDCALCTLLTKYKAGYAGFQVPKAALPHVAISAATPHSVPPSGHLQSAQPRGPPALIG